VVLVGEIVMEICIVGGVVVTPALQPAQNIAAKQAAASENTPPNLAAPAWGQATHPRLCCARLPFVRKTMLSGRGTACATPVQAQLRV